MPTEHLQSLSIRDIREISELREVEEIQKDVWGGADREVFPALALVPMIEVGAVLVGGFAGDRMVGFVFGFPGLEKARLILHSHMLAVRPEYRSASLGYQLKLAQRERALAGGIDTVTWTFDPLQSLNAHLNFGKLGVVADSYRINYYGETSSLLHQTGTDRLWVTWHLNSHRVRRRIEAGHRAPSRENYPTLVRMDERGKPIADEAEITEDTLLIEIPRNINALQEKDMDLALCWRETTRRAFTRAIDAGYLIEEFFGSQGDTELAGAYLLRRREAVELSTRDPNYPQ